MAPADPQPRRPQPPVRHPHRVMPIRSTLRTRPVPAPVGAGGDRSTGQARPGGRPAARGRGRGPEMAECGCGTQTATGRTAGRPDPGRVTGEGVRQAAVRGVADPLPGAGRRIGHLVSKPADRAPARCPIRRRHGPLPRERGGHVPAQARAVDGRHAVEGWCATASVAGRAGPLVRRARRRALLRAGSPRVARLPGPNPPPRRAIRRRGVAASGAGATIRSKRCHTASSPSAAPHRYTGAASRQHPRARRPRTIRPRGRATRFSRGRRWYAGGGRRRSGRRAGRRGPAHTASRRPSARTLGPAP